MQQSPQEDFSLRRLFVPLTTWKAINIFIVVGFLVFGNMLLNEFVWDDKTFIILNPEVHSVNIPFLLGTNLFNDTVYYRPIPAIYFASLYSLFSTNPFPYHLAQLILHIFNTSLLYILFTKFFKKELSLVLALVFLVHPMQVESVSYIGQTVSPIFFFFGISALLLSMRKKVNVLPQVSGLLLLSVLTKETGVISMFLVNLYQLIFNRSKLLFFVAASIGTLIVYFLIRFFIGNVYFAKSLLIAPIANISLGERIYTMLIGKMRSSFIQRIYRLMIISILKIVLVGNTFRQKSMTRQFII